MKKFLKVLGIVLVLLGIGALIIFIIGKLQRRGAGILIETTPSSTVLINGEQVGRTPYQGVHDPGEVIIKLVPDSFEKPLVPFETKVTLTPVVQTVIKREFGESDDLSSGVIVSFEKVSGSETSVAVVSIPDAAQIAVDGQVRGFAPYKTSGISKGEHELAVSAKGYAERSLQVRVVEGYKLTTIFKLAPSGDVLSQTPIPSTTPSPTPIPQMVEILNTGTGFLRVRENPGTASKEIGTVVPGSKYPLIEKDQTTGWLKIEYMPGRYGWVTNEFAKIVEGGATASPSATPRPSTTPRPSSSPSL